MSRASEVCGAGSRGWLRDGPAVSAQACVAALSWSIRRLASASDRSSGRSTPSSPSRPARSASPARAMAWIAFTWLGVADRRVRRGGRWRTARAAPGPRPTFGRAVAAGSGIGWVWLRPVRAGRGGRMRRSLEPGQLVVHGLPRRDVGVAHAGVEPGEVVIEQALVELQLQVAGGPGGAVVGQADLAADADVQA